MRELYYNTSDANEWILNKAGAKRELLDTVKARKLAYYGHTMRKQGNCLEKEIVQETIYTVFQKKWTTKLMVVTLSYLNRFSKCFHC